MDDPVGTLVLYLGQQEAARAVSKGLPRGGDLLAEHHPGVVEAVDRRKGVIVRFLGLELEPISSTAFLPDETGTIPGLVAVSGADWQAARSAGWWSGLAT